MSGRLLSMVVVGLVAGGAWAASAPKSGPQVGEPLAAFNVTKIAGPEDGVEIGQTLCYR